MAAAAPIPVDDQGRVDVDPPCLECGYNLRTQPLETGRCPECSLPVGRSVVGNQLRFCDPAWLTRVGHGLSALGLAGLAVGGIAGVTYLALQGHRSSYWQTHQFRQFIAGHNYLSVLVLLVTALACLYAAWRATAPDPMTRKDEWLVSTRKAARWCLVAFVAHFFVVVAAWTRAIEAPHHAAADWARVVAVAWSAWPITSGLGGFALVVYAASLADRARHAALGRWLRLSALAGLAAGGVIVLHATSWFGAQTPVGHWLGGFFAIHPPGYTIPSTSSHLGFQIGPYLYSTQPWYTGPFGLTYYAGPIDLWGVQLVSGDELLRRITRSSMPTLAGVLVVVALLMMRLWAVIRRQSSLALEGWAGEQPGRGASRG
ncbi:MAG: hypothetical protein AAF586_03840 [Planctomycetota bacterium]